VLDYLTTPARQAGVLDAQEHRPWPVPSGPWVMAQTWQRLLFCHWRVPRDELRPLVPDDLELDTFDGACWLGITPFCLSGLRLRGTFPVPRLSRFPEMNVRTYVTAGGKAGIWFFSLDARSRVAVELARRLYRLPYHHARMSMRTHDGRVEYSSARSSPETPRVFNATYEPFGEELQAPPGSLEHFLAERYCLYAAERSRLFRAEIHHPPWPLRSAAAEIALNTMAPVRLPDDEPLLHYGERQDVVVWPLERI
jgi:uncharacterized protein YqjF (DUF2071 family)